MRNILHTRLISCFVFLTDTDQIQIQKRSVSRSPVESPWALTQEVAGLINLFYKKMLLNLAHSVLTVVLNVAVVVRGKKTSVVWFYRKNIFLCEVFFVL